MVCKEVQVRGLLCGVDPARREPLAPILWRWMAWTLDNMLTLLVAMPLFGVLMALSMPGSASGPDQAWAGCVQLLFQGVMIVFPLLYEGFMLQSRAQTLGKMALRIRVTTADGSPIVKKHAWVRALIRMLVGFCCALIDYVTAFFRPDRATIHDMAASTSVRRCTGYGGVSCPRCGRALRHESLRTGLQVCPVCSASTEVVRFDPPARVILGPEPVALAAEESAPCALHPGNRTAGACGRCGRFLCVLCRVEEGGDFRCLSCFGKSISEGERPSVYRPLPNYAGYAALCALAAPFMGAVVLGFPFAAAGLFFCIKGLLMRSSRGEGAGGWTYAKLIFWNLLFLVLGVAAPVGIVYAIASEGGGGLFP